MAWSLQMLPSLSANQFHLWVKLIEERTGIQLLIQQKPWLESQLSHRLRERGLNDYDQYYQLILGGLDGHLEWASLIDRIAVKETSFFRHRESIDCVRRHLQNAINNQTLNDSFEVWSLGCATGEEPYSLAMAINDCFELARLHPYYGITAMDISTSALKIGRRGIYSPRKLELISLDEKLRYFTPQNDGNYQIAAKLRDRVCFSRTNIIHTRNLPEVKLDVIFCQNVLIYFRRWLRRDLLNALVDRLKPGGLLVVGLGETADWNHPHMQRSGDEQVQAYIRAVQQ